MPKIIQTGIVQVTAKMSGMFFETVYWSVRCWRENFCWDASASSFCLALLEYTYIANILA